LEDEKSVTIIIVNWNQKNTLATCLASLKRKTFYKNYNVIVVDNGSRDGSLQVVKDSFPWVDLIDLDKNYGFAIGNNKGIAYALKKYNPQYFLLLNNDTEIFQSDWLSKMVSAAEAEQKIGIVGCKLIYPNGKTQYLGTKITYEGLSWINPAKEATLPNIFDVDAVLGACFLIKREVIDKIGFLDVGFSPFVHEESDFCMRARKAGFRIVMVLDALVVHHWRLTTAKVNSEYVEYVERRNFVRFILLNYPISWLAKRKVIEMRLFVSCFFARGKGRLPIRLRTGRELLVRLNINVYVWVYNLKNLREILAKRENRASKLLAIE
jgi:hypothetical protein